MTPVSPDSELVTAYAAEGSEPAFRTLVARHVNLVYATARRQVGDAGLAEEITQNVFIALARKAPRLAGSQTLAGWLHRTAILEAKARIRAELRRGRRENIAAQAAALKYTIVTDNEREFARIERRMNAGNRVRERLPGALALAAAARCRGLLAAARGDLGTAEAAVDEAERHHARIPQPFDLARTLLMKGRIQRRLKRKRFAREALEGALAAFEDLGAPLWAEKARGELGRIGGRAPSPRELTPTERRVADLVGQGMTNREVATSLFMSEHTVRANLKRIYPKLGIRSRTELAARLRDQGHSPSVG